MEMERPLKTGPQVTENPELMITPTGWIIIGYLFIAIALIGGIAFGILTYRKKKLIGSYSNI